MGWWSNLLRRPGVETPATRSTKPAPPGVQPPARESRLELTASRAMTLIPVYRSVSIISSAVAQLTLDLWRGEDRVNPEPTWVRRPDVKVPRSAWLEMTATSLALHGNAFWRVERTSPADAPGALLVLDPTEVAVNDDGTFSHRGHRLARWQVQHLALLRVPGRPRGLGPIQAAAEDLSGAADLRDYASEWFDTGTVPNGILSSEQHLTAEQAKAMKDRWVESVSGREPAVMGHGLDYKPVLLSPKDAQFLESRQFTVTDIARLFGVPAHLLHAVVEGGSMTYMSGQAADLSFTRWTLIQYIREIEESFTALLPRGQSARFNLDAILRPATKERHEAHRLALEAGWATINEIRDIEGLPRVDGGDTPAGVREP